MGKIHIDLFSTLDGRAQAPGGPDEDPEGGFAYGGWMAQFFDSAVDVSINRSMEEFDALLLGRKTYAIFADFWPHQEDGINGEVARMFNRIPKYVASRSKPDLSWNNSVLLGPDLPSEMARIKQQHEHIRVIGSLDFVQTLLANRFFDTISLWVFPLTLGTGKPVFGTGTIPANLTLLAPPLAGPKGGVLLRYGRADGEPTSGDMSEVVLEG